MHFVYVIISEIDGRTYVGLTNDINRRIKEHNSGNVEATSYRRPFKIVSYFAFDSLKKARQFERYLKTGSGRAFLKKRVF